MHNHMISSIDSYPANMRIVPIRPPHLYLVMDNVSENHSGKMSI